MRQSETETERQRSTEKERNRETEAHRNIIKGHRDKKRDIISLWSRLFP